MKGANQYQLVGGFFAIIGYIVTTAAIVWLMHEIGLV